MVRTLKEAWLHGWKVRVKCDTIDHRKEAHRIRAAPSEVLGTCAANGNTESMYVRCGGTRHARDKRRAPLSRTERRPVEIKLRLRQSQAYVTVTDLTMTRRQHFEAKKARRCHEAEGDGERRASICLLIQNRINKVFRHDHVHQIRRHFFGA
jgi:hypothetical protein